MLLSHFLFALFKDKFTSDYFGLKSDLERGILEEGLLSDIILKTFLRV